LHLIKWILAKLACKRYRLRIVKSLLIQVRFGMHLQTHEVIFLIDNLNNVLNQTNYWYRWCRCSSFWSESETTWKNDGGWNRDIHQFLKKNAKLK